MLAATEVLCKTGLVEDRVMRTIFFLLPKQTEGRSIGEPKSSWMANGQRAAELHTVPRVTSQRYLYCRD